MRWRSTHASALCFAPQGEGSCSAQCVAREAEFVECTQGGCLAHEEIEGASNLKKEYVSSCTALHGR